MREEKKDRQVEREKREHKVGEIHNRNGQEIKKKKKKRIYGRERERNGLYVQSIYGREKIYLLQYIEGL